MPLPAILEKVVDWLRAGYPNGVPEVDYIPLFALLSRRLTPEGVQQVIDELVQEGQLNQTVGLDMVRKAITAVTEQPALQSDIERIQERLSAVGWVIPAPVTGEDRLAARGPDGARRSLGS